MDHYDNVGYLLTKSSLVVLFTVIFVFELPLIVLNRPDYIFTKHYVHSRITLTSVITIVHYLDVCNILRLLKLV